MICPVVFRNVALVLLSCARLKLVLRRETVMVAFAGMLTFATMLMLPLIESYVVWIMVVFVLALSVANQVEFVCMFVVLNVLFWLVDVRLIAGPVLLMKVLLTKVLFHPVARSIPDPVVATA